ncbi:mechanosensitive ion channel family protein [Candidatus Micrarchaeota archaeon]|nr:mechanosensitive ion channel family protein [Candidatus Micrarchaeota archaeon]
MIGRIIMLLFLLAISILLWFVNLEYQNTYLEKSFSTVFVLAILYFIFKLVFEEILIKKIKESKARYSLRKTVSVIYFFVVIITLVAVWIESPEALLVTYGLIAAGIAVALQDLFKSLAGGVILLLFHPYKIGDRIEINSKHGDVIDIDILYTTLLEIREWVEGDQATGRLTIIPNNYVLSGVVNNYTKDNDFIWDEIWIPLTYDSNWKAASDMITKIVKNETKNAAKKASEDLTHIQEQYYLSKRPVEPQIFMKLTDNWISLHVRYVTHTRERRQTNANLSRLILQAIEKSKKVKIASTTIDIVGFPRLKK